MSFSPPRPTNTVLSQLLYLLNKCSFPPQLHQIQAQIILNKLHLNTTISYNFINLCTSLGQLDSALQLFNQLHSPHVFICNNLIKAFSHSPSPQKAIPIYTKMHKNSIQPNNFTFPFILKSISDLKLLKQGQIVHTHIIKTGHLNDLYVQNALLNLYSSCGDMNASQQLFDEMPKRDAVSWTVMITGNRNAGNLDEALITFECMQLAGVAPNRVTMVNALSSCAGYNALEMGVWIHDYITRNGWELDVILGTSLIDMYGKCGRIDIGLQVFDSMVDKNVFTWNSLIRGLAVAKNGEEAVSRFYSMEEEGIEPDKVSLICALCACSHSGLVQIGSQIFHSMVEGKYGFSPGIKHYGCMIDLLGRAGYLQEARELIAKMPMEPNSVIWGALLGGSRAHGDLALSELAAKKLVEIEPEKGAYYVVLSNLYAEMGRWSDVEKVRRLMKDGGIKKDMGWSLTEVEEPNKNVYGFLAP